MLLRDLKGLIIRNDHDELLILLERAKATNQTIINYDRHSDLYRNEKVDVGSWGYYGKKWGVIGQFVWVPANEGLVDSFRIRLAKRKISKIKKPVIISICYDYLAGLEMKTNLDIIKKQVQGITTDIRKYGLSIQFIYASRSPQWSQLKYIEAIDQIIIDEFKKFGFEMDKSLSHKALLGQF